MLRCGSEMKGRGGGCATLEFLLSLLQNRSFLQPECKMRLAEGREPKQGYLCRLMVKEVEKSDFSWGVLWFGLWLAC